MSDMGISCHKHPLVKRHQVASRESGEDTKSRIRKPVFKPWVGILKSSTGMMNWDTLI